MQPQAVLFDVGGPLDTEHSAEALIDRRIRAALAAEGVQVTDAEYAAANRRAVDTFASNAYQAIFWDLCGGNVEMAERFRGFSVPDREFELRVGIPELLATAPG